jgi:hypothetical protein
VNFSATLICPIGDPERNRISKFQVDNGELGSDGVSLVLAQNVCTWEGFQINGVDVTGSVMTGFGPSYQNGLWSAEGYDFGLLANGDRYLAKWSEKGDRTGVRGSWKLLMGTGSIAGITGEATFEERAPQPGDTSVRATVTGWYILRVGNQQP